MGTPFTHFYTNTCFIGTIDPQGLRLFVLLFVFSLWACLNSGPPTHPHVVKTASIGTLGRTRAPVVVTVPNAPDVPETSKMLEDVSRMEFPGVDPDTVRYFKDVYLPSSVDIFEVMGQTPEDIAKVWNTFIHHLGVFVWIE